jgi:hypothetical protein
MRCHQKGTIWVLSLNISSVRVHLVWGLVWSVQHIKVPTSLLHLLHVCMMSSVWSLKKDITHHSLQLDISKIMTQNVLHKHQRLHICWVNWDMKSSEKIQICKFYTNMQLKKVEDFLMQIPVTHLFHCSGHLTVTALPLWGAEQPTWSLYTCR